MAVGASNAVSAYRAALERLRDTQGAGGAEQQQLDPNAFSTMVRNFAEDAVKTGETAERQTAAAAAGQADLNTVVMAVAEAELTLNTVVAVRDKVIEAYREIIRMPL